jgi:hypothetical protein
MDLKANSGHAIDHTQLFFVDDASSHRQLSCTPDDGPLSLVDVRPHHLKCRPFQSVPKTYYYGVFSLNVNRGMI